MTAAELQVRVVGHEPAPQGSFFAILVKGRPTVVADNKATGPWRKAVVEAARSAMYARGGWTPISGAVEVVLALRLTRPKSVKRAWPCVRPDADKLARSTLDALTDSGVLLDDGQVVRLVVEKAYASEQRPAGATILVRPYGDQGALL